MSDLVTTTDKGLYCPPGDFYIDPWKGVPRAVITHAHSDHAYFGSEHYLAALAGRRVLTTRIGAEAPVQWLEYGEAININGVQVSLHPAGHILGSAQVRIEHQGEVWVVSGDYKLGPDKTCLPFEPLRCDVFITESTFGLPIYHWAHENEIFDQINAWWHTNQQAGKTSLLLAYSLGKAQRLIAGVNPDIGPIFLHGAVARLTQDYRDSGVALPKTHSVAETEKGYDWSRVLVIAPPSAASTPWARRFMPYSTGFASGWMRVRGMRRRRVVDRGFALSDHADWNSLLRAIDATGAQRVLVTHGYSDVLVRWLTEHGKEAAALKTEYEGEPDEAIE